MRLLLGLLCVVLAVFLNCDAASVDTNNGLERRAPNKLIFRSLAAGDDLKRDKSLSIANLKTTEERSVGLRFSAITEKLKRLYRNWEMSKLEPRFNDLVKERKTYSAVLDDTAVRMQNSGRWGTPSGFKRFAEFYKSWLIKNNHADLAV
ncbi:secreted RxLR effector peptide protein, putative [Phytophthora infestans T30-4]|uniref:Secreted RxLR effector peptide protein, putative n=1 Tax=Phytophthora infestans (strain T30-4) TaxID=403677 RepID=D0N5A1_PHYIT|nr:secreted RxLR effector peptide protein, putative [Phytophthora infestans T30-4]EEY70059.1 secreted RxLR effector peptide protein, putative [Phytophthora infestans T30-4]|eukprot:XP_002998706.1 secreted RxLR effector peptide protein, putative [Phytophthora infestans T30-4]